MSGSADPDDESEEAPFTAEKLIDAAYAGFSSKNRKRISRSDVERVVMELKIDEQRPARKPPALRVYRLRFAGQKCLPDRPAEPFEYDQTFAPGVNIICIPDNGVGKSSILKTIKYALTGDNGDYDADVRNWITDIWLAFALDNHKFTVLLSSRNGSPRALLIPGYEFRSIETAGEETALVIFDVSGPEAIKDELKQFFFRRFGFGKLAWTQQDASVPSGVGERSTSWLTYFQALQIPDGGDRYLLCDQQHAMGNQDGLIFSAFLGLHLAEPLNQLGLDAMRTKKEARFEALLTSEQVQQAQEEAGRLETELQAIRKRLAELNSLQALRWHAFEGGEPAKRLVAVQSALVEKASEKAHLEVEREELNRTIQQRRARERLLREAVALEIHFTGLEVSLCPNCDSAVDTVAVEQEQTTHVCRLCGKPGQATDPEEIAALVAEADAIRREIEDMVHGRNAINARLSSLCGELETLTTEADMLAKAAQQGISLALLTADEEAERNGLLEQAGGLQALLSLARQKSEPQPNGEESDHDLHVRVVEKVRDVLRKEANRRNRQLLERLSVLTQEMARGIGAESISDVTCSPLGTVELRKHGERVRFTGIQNEGERLRVKLAFFLAMMRLGREPGLGRHPGFLLIDQPGSGEMVREDFEALAGIFRRVDDELTDQVQIICSTARLEFKMATDPRKIYGGQNPPYAF